MNLFVGAYSCSPTLYQWDPALEEAYFAGLADLPGLRGLELPWNGSLHPHDPDWLLANLRPEWDLVITSIGYTTGALARNAHHGLASEDATGRREAVANVRRILEAISALEDVAGRRRVTAVEIHSAPGSTRSASGNAWALARSLDEIASWNWGGTELLLEHCDARVDEYEPAKGYLSVAEEISAIRDSSAPVRLSMNWGRSAVELRSASGVADQIRSARESELLSAVVFSGASDRDSEFGAAWADAHLPFGETAGFHHSEPTSLLSLDLARECLRAAGPLSWVGLKFGIRPHAASVQARLGLIREGMAFISRAQE